MRGGVAGFHGCGLKGDNCGLKGEFFLLSCSISFISYLRAYSFAMLRLDSYLLFGFSSCSLFL